MTEDKNTPPNAEDGAASADPAAGAEDADTAAQAADDNGGSDRVRQLETELAELKDKSLRALADAENTRRRAQRELNDARKYAAGGIIKDLLNVSDNLNRALEAVPDEVRAGDDQVKNLILGVEMVEKDLLSAFEKHGVRKIEPLGEPFNHEFHQAMYEVENSGKPSGTIVELLQPGFVMHDRLLRPAMVAVAKGDPGTPPDDRDRIDTTA